MPCNSRRIQPPDSLRIDLARVPRTAVGPIRRINTRIPAKSSEVRTLRDQLLALLLHELQPCDSLFYRPSDVCLGEQDRFAVLFDIITSHAREPTRTFVVGMYIGSHLFARPKPFHLRVQVIVETKQVDRLRVILKPL